MVLYTPITMRGKTAPPASRAGLLPLLLGVVCALSLAGCALTRPTVVGSAPGFDGFPLEPTVPPIWVEAVLHPGAESVLGADLTEDDVLPLAVRVGLVGDEAELGGYRLDAATFAPRLVLRDGTVLGVVSAQRLERSQTLRRLFREYALRPGPLRSWLTAHEGLLFFELGDVRVKDHYALTDTGARYREVDLYHSLLAFEVQTPDGPREVCVGVRSTFGRGGR